MCNISVGFGGTRADENHGNMRKLGLQQLPRRIEKF